MFICSKRIFTAWRCRWEDEQHQKAAWIQQALGGCAHIQVAMQISHPSQPQESLQTHFLFLLPNILQVHTHPCNNQLQDYPILPVALVLVAVAVNPAAPVRRQCCYLQSNQVIKHLARLPPQRHWTYKQKNMCNLLHRGNSSNEKITQLSSALVALCHSHLCTEDTLGIIWRSILL